MSVHKQFFAAHDELIEWARGLQVGDALEGKDGEHYTVKQRGENFLVIASDMQSRGLTLIFDDVAKWALVTKAQRLCRNCHRHRKEHLKKAKCLFGPGVWK